jgi:ThiF family
MQIAVKIPRQILQEAIRDLSRPHSFAAERVGFFSTRCSKTDSTILVHCFAYNSIADEHYLEDHDVGARISSEAITRAMSRAVTDSAGQIHVHSHGNVSHPIPSRVDLRELPKVARSLRNANLAEVHGWMVVSNENAWISLLLADRIVEGNQIYFSVIGFPVIFTRRCIDPALPKNTSSIGKPRERTRASDRYDRQSFLGTNAEAIIGDTKVGIIGLGGGGSHLTQQLAHVGFRNFVLCDPDRISESNLNRLVGATLIDVRKKALKVAIAERNIRRLHTQVRVTAQGSKWEDATDDLIGCNLILGCVDSFCTRRDLEAFCRRHLIPYIDVGMDVMKSDDDHFEIFGQVILSMPGNPCMHCMGFLNDSVLALEAQNYGAAGTRPQVVWSNGLLCSAAVGIVVDLITDWSHVCRGPVYLSFRGSQLTLQEDNRLSAVRRLSCQHFPLFQAGDPVFTSL